MNTSLHALSVKKEMLFEVDRIEIEQRYLMAHVHYKTDYSISARMYHGYLEDRKYTILYYIKANKNWDS